MMGEPHPPGLEPHTLSTKELVFWGMAWGLLVTLGIVFSRHSP